MVMPLAFVARCETTLARRETTIVSQELFLVRRVAFNVSRAAMKVTRLSSDAWRVTLDATPAWIEGQSVDGQRMPRGDGRHVRDLQRLSPTLVGSARGVRGSARGEARYAPIPGRHAPAGRRCASIEEGSAPIDERSARIDRGWARGVHRIGLGERDLRPRVRRKRTPNPTPSSDRAFGLYADTSRAACEPGNRSNLVDDADLVARGTCGRGPCLGGVGAAMGAISRALACGALLSCLPSTPAGQVRPSAPAPSVVFRERAVSPGTPLLSVPREAPAEASVTVGDARACAAPGPLASTLPRVHVQRRSYRCVEPLTSLCGGSPCPETLSRWLALTSCRPRVLRRCGRLRTLTVLAPLAYSKLVFDDEERLVAAISGGDVVDPRCGSLRYYGPAVDCEETEDVSKIDAAWPEPSVGGAHNAGAFLASPPVWRPAEP